MPHLTLFCMPGACSRATMIALEETGAPFEARMFNLAKGEQRSAEFLAVNPKGKVPALVIDGTPLTENPAILCWLADTYPEARLLPQDTLARAQAISAVTWLASSVLTAISRIGRPERITDDQAALEGIRAKAREDIAASLTIAEQHMTGRTWWVDDWSVADAYLFYIVEAMPMRNIDLSPFPALQAHAARMKQRPATQRMLAWEAEARKTL